MIHVFKTRERALQSIKQRAITERLTSGLETTRKDTFNNYCGLYLKTLTSSALFVLLSEKFEDRKLLFSQ